MKTAWIDLETTGLNPEINGIIQISGFIEINGQTTETINLLTSPFPDQVIEPEALEVNRRSSKEIESFPNPVSIYKILIKTLNTHVDKYDKKNKLFFAGYNAIFDMNFLRKFFYKNGDNFFGSYFFFPPLDIMALAAFKLAPKRHHMPNFKLATVAKELGITFEESATHDGMFDIQLTYQIYKALANL